MITSVAAEDLLSRPGALSPRGRRGLARPGAAGIGGPRHILMTPKGHNVNCEGRDNIAEHRRNSGNYYADMSGI